MTFLWTFIPFLIFIAVIIRFEMRHRRRERRLTNENARYMNPLAMTTSKMFEKQYGRRSEELEKTFPALRSTK